MKKKELYEDVLDEEPEDMYSKEHKKWQNRLYKSIGWTYPEEEYTCACDKKGKTQEGVEVKEKMKWEVIVDVDYEGFTCNSQIEAETLSYLVQINERLKRLEKKLK